MGGPQRRGEEMTLVPLGETALLSSHVPPQRCPVTKGVNAINKDSVCWFSYEAQHPLKLVQEEKHVLQGTKQPVVTGEADETA